MRRLVNWFYSHSLQEAGRKNTAKAWGLEIYDSKLKVDLPRLDALTATSIKDLLGYVRQYNSQKLFTPAETMQIFVNASTKPHLKMVRR